MKVDIRSQIRATKADLLGRGADLKSAFADITTAMQREAERIAREEHGSTKLAVISGVGTRHYYRKLGYELEDTYMVKYL